MIALSRLEGVEHLRCRRPGAHRMMSCDEPSVSAGSGPHRSRRDMKKGEAAHRPQPRIEAVQGRKFPKRALAAESIRWPSFRAESVA